MLQPVKAKNHARVTAKELPALPKAISEYGGALTGLAMRLMAYAFVRTSELVGALWAEFTLDCDSPRWDIPAERMKMDSPHIVPLANQGVDILRTLQKLTGAREFVFPGHGKAKHMSTGTILHKLTRMGFRRSHIGRVITRYEWHWCTAFRLCLKMPWSGTTRLPLSRG